MAAPGKAEAAILTEIMLAVFRLNGRLLERGDRLVAPVGLTSSRWQVLGAVALAGTALSAPQIADAMGVTRQGTQKQLNLLEADGLFKRTTNPRHLRSPLYDLTDCGRKSFAEAMTLQATWARSLASNLSQEDLEKTLETLNAIHERLAA